MDARRLPYREEFDLIGAFDVLEHVTEDTEVLAQMRAAVRPGGGILLTVPQHPGLWSRLDDEACHKRRYTRRELEGKVFAAGFRTFFATSFVSVLLPAMSVARRRKRRPSASADPLAELRINGLLGHTLGTLLAAERLCIQAGVRLPAGGSLLACAVAR